MQEITPLCIDFSQVAEMSKPEIRNLIARIEEAALDGTPIDIPIKHHFSKAIYAREMEMPAGALIVGKIHKHQNLNILSQGEATVLSVDGVVRIKAPFTFVSEAGAKRVIYAHEDVVWTTIHGTEETDVEKIEELFIAKKYEDVPGLDLPEVIQIQEVV